VYKRLKLTLELVKKEMEISKIQVIMSPAFLYVLHWTFHNILKLIDSFQESIAKAIEEKISGEQRRYLLNEQLKAIKKVRNNYSIVYVNLLVRHSLNYFFLYMASTI